MKYYQLTIIILLLNTQVVFAQSDLIFKSGLEFVPMLNDTGITLSGEYPLGNNTNCISTTINSPQDCDFGRDSSFNIDNNGHAGFSFTKLDSNGNPLADQSANYATTPWACVKDNITGLVWEVKTTTVGIHNMNNTYQWGGLTAIGRDHQNRQGVYYEPSWNELILGSNQNAFCGINSWRVPTKGELDGLINHGSVNPAIDTNYFPNTMPVSYWTSSPIAGSTNINNAFASGFGFGGHDAARINNINVRLVH